MRLPKSLQGRLTIAYATALFAGLCLFAAVSGFFLVQLSGAVLDARLRATAIAATAIAVDSGDGLVLDSGDARQFARVVTTALDGALVRKSGEVVLTTSSGVPPAIREAMRGAAPGVTLKTVITPDDELRVGISNVEQRGRLVGTVAVWESMDPIEGLTRLLLAVYAIGIPVIVGLAAYGAGFIARRGLSPLRDIARVATDIEAHDLSGRLRPQSEEDELGNLSATFDRMLDRLQAAFERQRRFTADASHELRAPLSIVRAESDLALRRSRDAQEYRQALESIASEADRMEALIGDLLALARTESARSYESAPVDLTPLVADAVDRLRAVAAIRNVRIEADLAPSALVLGDGAVLARVPLALVHNAVKYAADGGSVQVRLAVENERVVRIVVKDDGPGFSDEGLRRATERFWRDDQARGPGGSGLGLAIVLATVEQSGGTMELHNAPGGGAEVNVTLPGLG